MTRKRRASKRGAPEGSHLHIGVRDLAGALRHVAKVWGWKPVWANAHMAVLPFGNGTSVLLDKEKRDIPATIAFASRDCDRDFARAVKRGAKVVERPADKPWGVRAAYVKGPGKLTFELEQPL